MSRKLYALFILIGAIGSLVLAYLYFFVYYTATLTIDANVDNYRVELFSIATAQKFSHECPEKLCVISGVSPFDYNISIIKADYETKIISAKIGARATESILLQLEKKVDLVSFEKQEIIETNRQKIQRLREESIFYARFAIDNESTISFIEQEEQLILQYSLRGEDKQIQSFTKVNSEDIFVDSISSSENIFIALADDKYIFDTAAAKLYKLPYTIDIHYIKSLKGEGEYLIITENGSFHYDTSTNISEFQYVFKDFLYFNDDIIGIIYSDEDQKKSNFNLPDPGNLIVKYSPSDKTRKILYATNLNIDKLEWQEDKIIFSVGEDSYELKNFD